MKASDYRLARDAVDVDKQPQQGYKINLGASVLVSLSAHVEMQPRKSFYHVSVARRLMNRAHVRRSRWTSLSQSG